MSAEADADMRERLGRVLALLQATPLSLDLIDNPAQTGQWLITLGNLGQAIALLRPAPAPQQALAAPGAYDTRGQRVVQAFNRMIEGLPPACLRNLSPVIKLGLIRPLLADLEALERRLRALPQAEVSAYTARLTQYRREAAAMAARHAAPDPPAPPGLVRTAASIPVR
jgi:hypothetical protein